MTILDLYAKEKQNFLNNCVQCGLCAEECPILPYTELGKRSAREIQENVFDFIKTGKPNQQAYSKAFACMECFKCTADLCPEDLNPMLVNELIKREYISRGLENKAYSDATQPESIHRVLASIQVSAADYRKITKPSGQQNARYVFFPGCNVYFQPEKILNALDIMDAIGDSYAFLPGLDNCCGGGAICWFPESCAEFRENRLNEAAKTGAERLVAVCHYCGQIFAAEEARFDFSVTNYVNLVAEAMGVRRDDKFKIYSHWVNLDRIIKDANKYIIESPFDKDRIVEVLQTVFVQ